MEEYRNKRQSTSDYPPESIELHEACRRIAALALEMEGSGDGSKDRLRLETLVDREIVIVHRHLFRLARAITLDTTGAIYGGGGDPGDIENEALDAIVPLFKKRKSTGCREAVHVICLLFARNPDAGPADTLRWLCGAVKRSVSGSRREALRQRNPIYLSVCRRVSYFVDNSERFYRHDGRVRDSSIDDRETMNLRPAEAEDLVKLCANVSPPPRTIAETVTAIFDSLADGKASIRTSVPLRALQTAVYRILEPALIERCAFSRPLMPEEAFLVRESDRRALETARELEQDYRWRKDFDEETRKAIRAAAFDCVWDKLHRDTTESHFDYLATHLSNCTRDTFDREYKGSLQNLIGAFEERLRKKLRADS